MERKEFARLCQQAFHVGVLQAKVKERSMIYQCSDKEIVAAYYNMSMAEVNLPYEQWCDLRQKYVRESGDRL